MIFDTKISYNVFVEAIPRGSPNLGVIEIGTTRHQAARPERFSVMFENRMETGCSDFWDVIEIYNLEAQQLTPRFLPQPI